MPGLVSINSTGISDRKLFEMNRLARVTRLIGQDTARAEVSHFAIFGQIASPLHGNIDLHTKGGVAISVSWDQTGNVSYSARRASPEEAP